MNDWNIYLYAMADYTGEGFEAEVWMRLFGESEPYHIANQYPFETEDEAIEAANRMISEIWEQAEFQEALDRLVVTASKIGSSLSKDFR